MGSKGSFISDVVSSLRIQSPFFPSFVFFSLSFKFYNIPTTVEEFFCIRLRVSTTLSRVVSRVIPPVQSHLLPLPQSSTPLSPLSFPSGDSFVYVHLVRVDLVVTLTQITGRDA